MEERRWTKQEIRWTTKIGELSKKVQERRLQWYGHVMRREEECVGRRVMALQADGDRRRGRPKWRWMDNITGDMRQNGLTMEDARDRARWKRLIRHVDPT